MKDQYVADVNDYVKYSLLRAVQAQFAGRLLVCWMRTARDERRDGQVTGYLREPVRFRSMDPVLFDALGRLVDEGRRTLRAVEEADLIPRAEYFAELLVDDAGGREAFFGRLRQAAARHDVLFFDPDNGLQVPSVPRGRRDSARYLYLDELSELAAARSAIVYQHFPRVDRPRYLARRLALVRSVLPDHAIFALYSSRVAWLFATLPRHEQDLRTASAATLAAWQGALKIADS